MKYLILSITLLISEFIAAQSFYLRGKITDVETGQPVENAIVSVTGSKTSTAYSSADGSYSVVVQNAGATIRIVINAINYKSIETEKKVTGRDMQYDVRLQFAPVMLPEVGIHSGPDTVWSSAELNVADFVIRPGGLLLLTYEKEERWKRQEDSKTTLYSGCRLISVDSTGREIKRKLITELCKGFQTNFFGDVFLMTHKKIHLVDADDEDIFLSEIDRKVYEQQIQPVVDSIRHHIYLSNYNKDFPAFEYLIYNTGDSSQQVMRYIEDEEMMKMFRSEYKYLQPREKLEAFRFELETGVDREVIAAYMRGFQNTYYYEPINAPLLVANDTLLLFDHNHSKLIRFDQRGNAIDSTEIAYHKNNKLNRWSETLVKDLSNDEVYTYYERDGYHYVKKINRTTGATGNAMKLTHRYSENLRVHAEYVYYVYRPYESAQKKFLYREQLRSDL